MFHFLEDVVGSLIKFIFILLMVFILGVSYLAYEGFHMVQNEGLNGVIHQVWCGKNGCKKT